MIKSSADMVTETRKEMRGGRGEINIAHIFAKEEMRSKCRIFARIEIKPGCSIGTHEHVDEEEIYYVIKGSGTVNDNGTIRKLSAGDAVITGGGESHSIENTGEEPLEMIAAVLLFPEESKP
ncbi:MAG: cupin domain-containing protein [Eubacteriales bacterium]|nr:cupin domain-containing protein [Eubacteriales bacterium]